MRHDLSKTCAPWWLSLLLILLVLGTGSCGKSRKRTISNVNDLNQEGFVIGSETGTYASTIAKKQLSKATVCEYPDINATLSPLLFGKLNAVVYDRPYLEHLAIQRNDYVLLPENLGMIPICVAAPLSHRTLISQVNEFIRLIHTDGTFLSMYSRWIRTPNPSMPKLPVPEKPDGTLVVAMDGTSEPMNFVQDGEMAGFEVEFALRLANFLNKKLEIKVLDYNSIFPAVTTNKVDLAIAQLEATEERRESMLFSHVYMVAPVGIMVCRKNYKGEKFYRKPIRSLADLNYCTAAVEQGAVFDKVLSSHYQGVRCLHYSDFFNSAQAVINGAADVLVADDHVIRTLVARYPQDLVSLGILEPDYYGLALAKNSPLKAKVDAVILEMKKTGELQRLITSSLEGKNRLRPTWKKWLRKKDSAFTGGVLRYGLDPVLEPSCYFSRGQYVGYEVELVRRIARKLDMKLEFHDMNFSQIQDAVIQGQIDIGGGSMSITEERKKVMDFTVPYYDGGIAVLARKNVEEGEDEIEDFAQLKGKKVGIWSNSIMDDLTSKVFSEVSRVYYPYYGDLLDALERGQIDAFLSEEMAADYHLSAHPNLKAMDQRLTSCNYAFCFQKKGSELRDAFNAELEKLRKDGTLDKLLQKWLHESGIEHALPVSKDKSRGVLKVGYILENPPFCYARNGKLQGFDIELCTMIAERLGYGVTFIQESTGDFETSLEQGNLDMVIGCIGITEQRKNRVLFSDSYCSGDILVIVRKKSPGVARLFNGYLKKQFLRQWKSFRGTFLIEARWKLIAKGMWVSFAITLQAAILGTLLAVLFCRVLRSSRAVLRKGVRLLVAFLKGTPILVLLLGLYYVVFINVDVDGIIVAVIGFSLNFAAFVSDMAMAGLDAIPRSQYEAAYALGFTTRDVYRKVIIPQTVGSILPLYKNELVSMMKSTSIVGYIAVQDLTKVSDVIRSRTYEAFIPLLTTTVMYFAIAWLLTFGLNILQKRLDPTLRRAHKKENGK